MLSIPWFLVVSFAFVVRAEFQAVSVVNLPRMDFELIVESGSSLCSCSSFASEIGPVTCSQTMDKRGTWTQNTTNRTKQ